MRSSDLCRLLHDARRHQLAVFGDLDGTQLLGEQAHHVEPPIWEMGHVAWFQEFWILRHLDGRPPLNPSLDAIYDSFKVSYKLRWTHDYPSREVTLEYAAQVLDCCTRRIQNRAPTSDDEYFYQLVAQHEGMHTESLLLVRQSQGYPRPPGLCEEPVAPSDTLAEPHDVEVAGGEYMLGGLREYPFVFDNEKWAHSVEVDSFRIARLPVTNAEFAEFVAGGGYTERAHWGRRGWDWRRRDGVEQPLAWTRRDHAWYERVFDDLVPLRPWHPVCHVNWYEARAYCRFAGRRLPTEAEWEMAASWDPATETKRKFPWGEDAPTPEHANLDLSRSGPVDVRAFARGDSAVGCRQMIGNVWEWTDSILEPYPGFEQGPYAEYSAPYFGKKPVLRGGCFATRATLIRNSWRNFYVRHRRNGYAGFRTCAI